MVEASPADIGREFERELSFPLFYGVPLGSALSEALHRTVFIYSAEDGMRPPPYFRLLNQARIVRHRLKPRRRQGAPVSLAPGRILVTWLTSTPRYDDLIMPILDELEGGSYAVIYDSPAVASRLRPGVPRIKWDEILDYDLQSWRSEYERCRPEWQRRLKTTCARFDLAGGAYEHLWLSLLVASQRVLGCLEFLKRTRPAAVLTEYDRNNQWSCLILAARHLGIPTATLVHGVIDHTAFAFSPVIADTILCWGEMDKEKLLAAGEPPEKVVVTGCPRLTRELSATREQGRAKLGLDAAAPVAMYVSTPDPQSPGLVELFCSGIDKADGVLGLIRLHASEKREYFAASATRHPGVRFTANLDATVDEALAAADVVVTCRSGMGSDALVKGRPVVVLNPDTAYRGTDLDLVERGGCPLATTAEELALILAEMLQDGDLRTKSREAGERYAQAFCAAYGTDAARRIAEFVKAMAK